MNRDDIIVEDDMEDEDTNVPLQYGISFYGADYPVDSLVKRLENLDIRIPRLGTTFDDGNESIPGWQREFVWEKPRQDRFIESLLMGLPIPGIFLAKTRESHLLVLDGQQRLCSLEKFLTNNSKLGKFVQEKYQSKFYEDLDGQDKRRLNDCIIHATIIKQESPAGYDSIYHIFERLNSGGKILTPQQIRMALNHGKFANLLIELNQNELWQQLLHRKISATDLNPDPYLKDMELILRFFALFFNRTEYKNPMKNFLNNFMQEHQHDIDTEKYRELFFESTEFIHKFGGDGAFLDIGGKKPKAAVIDSLMYGIAKRLQDKEPPDGEKFTHARDSILGNSEYQRAINAGTSQNYKVKTRLQLSENAFKSI